MPRFLILVGFQFPISLFYQQCLPKNMNREAELVESLLLGSSKVLYSPLNNCWVIEN